MKNIIKNRQSAAKHRIGEGSTTIETIIETDNNNGVEYIKNIDGKGWDFQNSSYVYKHIRLDTNQIFYIGVGTDKNYKRAFSKAGRNIFWKRIIDKTDYRVEIIKDNMSIEEAYCLEIELINKYGFRYNNTGILCNLSIGGKGGSTGLIQSEETKKKKSDKLKGTKRTLQQRKNISDAKKNYVFTDSHKLNISKALKGRKLPKEVCEKMRKSRFKKVVQLQDDIVIKIWDSVKEASLYFNVNPSSIAHCCAGRKKKIANYNWKYLENYDIV